MGELRIVDWRLLIGDWGRATEKRMELCALFFETRKNEYCMQGEWMDGKWEGAEVFMVRLLFICKTEIPIILELMFWLVKRNSNRLPKFWKLRKS
jgi:hypothetical protein